MVLLWHDFVGCRGNVVVTIIVAEKANPLLSFSFSLFFSSCRRQFFFLPKESPGTSSFHGRRASLSPRPSFRNPLASRAPRRLSPSTAPASRPAAPLTGDHHRSRPSPLPAPPPLAPLVAGFAPRARLPSSPAPPAPAPRPRRRLLPPATPPRSPRCPRLLLAQAEPLHDQASLRAAAALYLPLGCVLLLLSISLFVAAVAVLALPLSSLLLWCCHCSLPSRCCRCPLSLVCWCCCRRVPRRPKTWSRTSCCARLCRLQRQHVQLLPLRRLLCLHRDAARVQVFDSYDDDYTCVLLPGFLLNSGQLSTPGKQPFLDHVDYTYCLSLKSCINLRSQS
ncbi:uncharacterized protein LOC104585540 [Brachypodium distachyon]|uniref:uncharacterized protein LOC104585540 n=1 Tax=Brachypodium distachyon TaxID=15368 RepID=UPI0005300502|nr:uncharacterized protein LOC104585540 [Brachypodium distachyon]|eukprot:XP_024311806.1 uncharacterized protein LOC104585540 [Brachypodium distachyon]